MLELTEQLAKEISEKLSWFEIKELWENGSFKVIASDETVDRAWEVIKVSWRDLSNFMKNPVIIANHIYTVQNIVWKATNIYVENEKLVVEWVFATTDLAQDVRKLYDWWFIKTVSVWFIPKERDENAKNIITKAELLEVSFVPVPCNPNALSLWKEIVEDLISKWLLIKEAEDEEEKKDSEENADSENQEEVVEETNEQETEETAQTDEEWAETEEEEKSVSLQEVLEEVKALRSEIKDFISNNRKEDDNSGELEDKDAKIKLQKEALQNVSKVVSDALHKIKL